MAMAASQASYVIGVWRMAANLSWQAWRKRSGVWPVSSSVAPVSYGWRNGGIWRARYLQHTIKQWHQRRSSRSLTVVA